MQLVKLTDYRDGSAREALERPCNLVLHFIFFARRKGAPPGFYLFRFAIIVIIIIVIIIINQSTRSVIRYA